MIMEGTADTNNKVDIVGDEFASLGAPVPAVAEGGGESAAEEAVMPVSDVMALLQAMREEQLDSLKSIADGVQQLQSQVMVLGESARASEGNTSLVLDRLAALEVRIGAIPVPMKPPDRNSSQWTQPKTQFEPMKGTGGGAARTLAHGVISQSGSCAPVSGRVPLPPPAGVAEPGRVSTWQARMGQEPAHPHFMRNTSPKQPRPSPANTSRPPVAAAPPSAPVRAADATGVVGGEGGAVPGATISPEETAAAKKEAQRLAFMQDRARIQARISATKGGGKTPAGGNSSPSNISPRTLAAEKSEALQTQSVFESPRARPAAAGLSSPYATPVGGGGVLSSGDSFLGGEIGGSRARGGADETAARLVREEQKERMERARREEEERLERQRAEARERKEEAGRKAREAEETRAREKSRREAEARKQAKTRDLMSSLFDKGEEDDGNSLFGGLAGVTLPVFTDENTIDTDYNLSVSSRAGQAAKSPAASVAPPPPSLGGSLFGGVEEPTRAGRGGLFDKPGSPFSERFSPPTGGPQSASKRDGGSGSFLDAEASPRRPVSQAGARVGGGSSRVGAGSGGSTSLFDSSPPTSQANQKYMNSKTMDTTTRSEAADDMDAFFSTLETSDVSAPSGNGSSGTAAAPVRGSLFGGDEFTGVGPDADIFSAPITAEMGGDAAGSSRGARNPGRNSGRAGTSLFDRSEFSIDSGGMGAGSLFGGEGGGDRVGDAKPGGGVEDRTSFLSALADTDLSLSGDDVGGDADEAGMVEVRF